MTKPGGEPTHREELEQRDYEAAIDLCGYLTDRLQLEGPGKSSLIEELAKHFARHRQAFALSERNDERERAARVADWGASCARDASAWQGITGAEVAKRIATAIRSNQDAE